MEWSIDNDAQLFVQNQHWAELRADAARRRLLREARLSAQRHPLARRFAALLSDDRDDSAPRVSSEASGRVISIERARPVPVGATHSSVTEEELSSA